MNVIAPGKLMLAGEYAVLDGGIGVAAAVDRHAIAVVGHDAALPPESREALELLRSSGTVREIPPLSVDVRALQHQGVKLGLGSSAAASVAVVGAALAFDGHTPHAEAERIARVARAAHRRVQGGGSGLDVLASALGGVLSVRLIADPDAEPEVRRLAWPAGLHLATYWTGHPVRTSDLLERVRMAREAHGRRVIAALDAIRTASSAFVRAFEHADAPGVLASIPEHHRAMRELGVACGASIVTDVMDRLATEAEKLGAHVKPSGAGGGDVVIAFACDPEALVALDRACSTLGVVPLGLKVDPRGVRERSEPQP